MVHKQKKSTGRHIRDYINKWEKRCYHEGIPDDVPKEIFDKAPSYKAIAIAILKNDLSVIGVDRGISEIYIELKRIEISKRPGKKSEQLKLF